MITINDIVSKLEELANAYPERIGIAAHEDGHDKCSYVHENKPLCIFGQAFYDFGLKIDTLNAMDDESVGKVFEMIRYETTDSSLLHKLLDRDNIVFENTNKEFIDVLNRIQHEQDRGAQWKDLRNDINHLKTLLNGE